MKALLTRFWKYPAKVEHRRQADVERHNGPSVLTRHGWAGGMDVAACCRMGWCMDA
jgi:hypothetical protein